MIKRSDSCKIQSYDSFYRGDSRVSKESAGYDYHTHTTYSDGDLTPFELIDRAKKNGVRVLSITDHDTIDAYKDPQLASYAKENGIDIIPGIEISSADEDGVRIHILGLGVDSDNPKLSEWSESVKMGRKKYASQVMQLLASNGWAIDPAEKQKLLDTPIVTKAHIADPYLEVAENRHLFAQRFNTENTRGAFIEQLMNDGGAAFVHREGTISPDKALELIRNASGAAFLAHPVSLLYEQGLSMDRVGQLTAQHGFDGIEAMYYYYHKGGGDKAIDMVNEFLAMAKYLGIAAIGGSDFHGTSAQIGNYTDVGMADVRIAPDASTHHSIIELIHTR